MQRVKKYLGRPIVFIVATLLILSPLSTTVGAEQSFEYLWPTPEIAANPNAYGEIAWISSNGQKAAVRITDPSTPTGNPQVWLVDRAAHQSELLTGVVNSPHLSNDSNLVLYTRIISPPGSSQYEELWLRDRTTGEETQIDADPTNPFPHAQSRFGAPGARSISDDGSVVLFAAWNFKVISGVPNNTYNLYAYNRLTDQYTLVNVPGEGEVFTGAISGNGRYVLYQARQGGSALFSIYRHDLLTGERQQVGTGRDCRGNSLRINQDGSVIAYTCPAQSQVVDLNTMESRNVFDGNMTMSAMSNDGKTFIGGMHGSYFVYSWVHNEARLVEEGALVGYPLLAGDGSTMAWTVERTAAPYYLYTPKIGPAPEFSSTDVTPPSITFTTSSMPHNNWFNTPVALNWNVEDPESTISYQLGCDDATVNADTSEAVFICEATSGGGTASRTAVIRYDATAPNIGTPFWTRNPKPVSESTDVSLAVSDELSGVQGGEYFIGDTDPGVGNGLAMFWNGTNLATTLGANLATGVHKISFRAQDDAGNWSSVVTDYLVIYNPDGFRMTGRRTVMPSLANGDVLPGLIRDDQDDKAIFGFNVRYNSQGNISSGSDLQIKYKTGVRCNNPMQAQNCHSLELNATSIAWLVTQGENNSTGMFQGVAAMVVDGTASQVLFRVTGVDGERVTPVSLDHFQIEIYPQGAIPGLNNPIYRVSNVNIERGNIKILQ